MSVTENASALLENVTPLKTDCGLLCSAACCTDNGEAGSCVWLLPGEEAGCDWGSVSSAVLPVTGIKLNSLYCTSPCTRSRRPFMCRIFPLSPYYSVKRGIWDVRMDRRAAAVCPLFKSGVRGLNPDFISAARAAVTMLSEDAEGLKLLKALYAEEDACRLSL